MRSIRLAVITALTGCATTFAGPVGADPAEVEAGRTAATDDKGGAPASSAVPDVRCAGAPAAGRAGKFRHLKNEVISYLGDVKHRGFDLMTTAAADSQTLAGWISYTVVDKALEDEDVDVFACLEGAWHAVGRARTDDEGRFALALTGDDRLPIGLRDLFVSVVGDRTGVGFLGYVAPAGARLIASDVDGTLTSSESAFVETIVLGIEPGARAGAAAAFAAVAAKGYQPVYVTARGNQYTAATRAWLVHKGFPRGPVRLSPSFFTLPGGDTVAYKTSALDALVTAGLDMVAGVGNRASDITAYAGVGVAADRIFIELPDYAPEVQPALDAHAARGFSSYDALRTGSFAELP